MRNYISRTGVENCIIVLRLTDLSQARSPDFASTGAGAGHTPFLGMPAAVWTMYKLVIARLVLILIWWLMMDTMLMVMIWIRCIPTVLMSIAAMSALLVVCRSSRILLYVFFVTLLTC